MNHLQPTDDIVSYDAWNRMVKVTDGSDVTIGAYAYDGRNYRITKAIYSSGTLSHTDHFYYNQNWQALEVRREVSGTEDTDPREQYVWHPEYIDALAVRYYDADTDGNLAEDSDGPHYYTQGTNYHVLAITNATGTVLERYHYDPYGRVTILDPDFTPDADNTSDIDNPYTFTGRCLDTESGLHYFRNRYHDASAGRFITQDPLQYVNGASLYASYFVPSSFDPTGTIFPGGAGGGVGPRPGGPGWPGGGGRGGGGGSAFAGSGCGSAAPKSDTSGCGVHAGTVHLGFDADCICRCAGSSPWDNQVRGCLECAERAGVDPTEAHAECYALADARHGRIAGWRARLDIGLNCGHCGHCQGLYEYWDGNSCVPLPPGCQ